MPRISTHIGLFCVIEAVRKQSCSNLEQYTQGRCRLMRRTLQVAGRCVLGEQCAAEEAQQL